jgi:hypothetical protein
MGNCDALRRVWRQAPVADVPSLGRRQSVGVATAQVVGVGVAVGGETIEPHLRQRILIRQRDGRRLAAIRP